jgi:hypothetical protein
LPGPQSMNAKGSAFHTRQATHVDADAKVLRDPGSIPGASTNTACDKIASRFILNTYINSFTIAFCIEISVFFKKIRYKNGALQATSTVTSVGHPCE